MPLEKPTSMRKDCYVSSWVVTFMSVWASTYVLSWGATSISVWAFTSMLAWASARVYISSWALGSTSRSLPHPTLPLIRWRVWGPHDYSILLLWEPLGDYYTRPDSWILHVICPYMWALCSYSLYYVSLSRNNCVVFSFGPHYNFMGIFKNLEINMAL